MKLKRAYNNQLLINALSDRDDTILSLADLDIDDIELEKIRRYIKLSQFHKDLLYLYSQMPVKEIALLYGVSRTLLYNHLRQIKKEL